MPHARCNKCPIIEYCNRYPLHVMKPTGKTKGGKPEMVKVRLCPLLIAISHAVENASKEAYRPYSG